MGQMQGANQKAASVVHAAPLHAQCIWLCMELSTVTGLIAGLSPQMMGRICGSCTDPGSRKIRMMTFAISSEECAT